MDSNMKTLIPKGNYKEEPEVWRYCSPQCLKSRLDLAEFIASQWVLTEKITLSANSENGNNTLSKVKEHETAN